ncbi:MAG: excinuclease ABC subunit UvrB [Candidatus Gracilibacteria bacterium]
MFNLVSKYSPTGDQPKAIAEILTYLEKGHKYQTLWGVTGSGKTFTMANIIQKIQKPTLIIAHNKTLAAQLAQEFKEYFPDNAVHYFVSYYDYYQPEAYVQKTDTYIEKEATINAEIDRLRHAATQSLITRKDVIIVASVSCIYGIGDIDAYIDFAFDIEVGKFYKIEDLLKKLVSMQFRRASSDFKPGTFQILGDVLEIFPSSEETIYTIEFWGEEVSQITRRNYLTGEVYEVLRDVTIFPAKHTVTTKERIAEIIPAIQKELDERLKYYKEELGDVLKYERLKTKVEYDIEMMQEVGYVNGIENYSRYLDGRQAGLPPATLIDYFKDDYLCFIDESHMTVPQIGGMYAGDKSRKDNLVNNGFRLPSALDNRPLKFPEFEAKMKQVVFVSATPSMFEIEHSGNTFEYFKKFDPLIDGDWISSEKNRIIPQVIRPTGLLDPEIEIKPMEFMIDDIIKTLDYVIEKNERMLITTITKRSSEELADYLLENGYKVRYLHSEIETLERLEILKMLRQGDIDVIVGVNLLREGLDLPEVSRIAIIDADKQGFLRSESALVQIIGRAARNSSGKVVMYTERLKEKMSKSELNCHPELVSGSGKSKNPFNDSGSGPEGQSLTTDKGQSPIIFALGILTRHDKGKLINQDGLVVSESMRKAIDLTYYRRKVQNDYNIKNNITPTTIFSTIKDMGLKTKNMDYAILDKQTLEKQLKRLELEMDIASANLEFEKAAEIRDVIIELRRGKKKK